MNRGWRCSFWGCVQGRPAETWECATLALLTYRTQWFTVIDVYIPECQNSLCLRGTSDSGCGFTSGHFLINSWTVLHLEKIPVGNTALSLICVCARIRGRMPLCGADLHLISAMVSLWGAPQPREVWEASGPRTALFQCFFRAFLHSPGVGACSSVFDST